MNFNVVGWAVAYWPIQHNYTIENPQLLANVETDKQEKVQRKLAKIPTEIQHHSYKQQLKGQELISILQRRRRGKLIEAFNNVSPRGLWTWPGLEWCQAKWCYWTPNQFNDRIKNTEKIIMKRFITSVDKHFPNQSYNNLESSTLRCN